MWEVNEESYVNETLPSDEDRWGVWSVSFPCEVVNADDVQRVLADLVPRLRPKWQAWLAGRAQAQSP